MTTTYDAIVLGAGAMGSAATYHLAKAGHHTLLLEQFELDHDKGSSFGHSRIIRYAYDYPVYVEMAKGVFPLWRELEAEADQQLMIHTGGLDFGRPDQKRFAETRRTLEATGIPFEVLTPQEVAQRFPQFRLDEDMEALYQAGAGMLRASACVKAHVRLARERHGADFVDNAKVHRILPSHTGVTVETSQGTYAAARLVMCVGSWTQKLLDPLGVKVYLQPTREQLVFFDAPAQFDVGNNMPIFICWADRVMYGMGSVDGTGLKVAQHGIHEPVDPDTINRVPDQDYIAGVQAFVRKVFPEAGNTVVNSRICMYTLSADEHFIIDQHPEYPHIAFGAGFSGHGFKFSPLIGQILSDMALGNKVTYDLSLFRWNRTVDKL